MNTLLEALIDSPDLPKMIEAATRVLEGEGARREQFYSEMTENQKTEFINGQVVLHSPAKRRHIEVSDLLQRLLSIYVDQRGLGWVAHEKLLVALTRNDYEPDVSFFRREKAASFAPDQMRFPAPDFIAEILSPSTESNDRRLKKRDYAAHGVAEYWIVDPEAQTIEQHVLQGDDYRLVGVWRGDESVTSAVIEGFRIPARAIFDHKANLAALAALSK